MSIEVQDDQAICCHKCAEGKTMGGIPISSCRMIVCTVCGNKRCPHAADHELACTGSNEPGQPGSLYPASEPADIVANAHAAKRQLLAELQAKTVDRLTNGGRRPLFDPESVPQQPGCRWFIKRDDALLLDRGFRTKAEASEWINQLGYRLDWRVGFTFKLRGEATVMKIVTQPSGWGAQGKDSTMSDQINQELLKRIQATEHKATKAVPGAEWFLVEDLSHVSNIDSSAAKLVSELDPEFVLQLCKLAKLGLAVEPVMTRLHGDIMNIQCDESKANDEYNDRRSAYKHAHRDARHAAAELAVAAFSDHLE